MKIAIDGGALSGGKTYGTYRVTEQLLRALSVCLPYEHQVDVFTLPNAQLPVLDTSQIQYMPVAPATGWMHFAVPLQLRRGRYDLFIALNQAIPSWWKGTVVTVSHGLSFLKFPEYYPDDYGRLKSQLDHYIERSDRILVSSQRVKAELIEYAPHVEPNIITTPFGLAFRDVCDLQHTRKEQMLYVGSNQPVKNVSAVIRTFKDVYKPDRTLVLAGVPRNSDLLNQAGKAAAGMHFLPMVSLDQLQVLYRSSAVTISCSKYESFAYPLLEAVQSSCPVVAYTSEVIPELEPFVTPVSSHDDMVEACKELLGSPTSKKPNHSLLEKTFSWEQFIRKGIIEYAAHSHRSRQK